MSLLEDVFLEDEAGEAQELERIIEGDEYDERPAPDSNENSEKEDEAEEDKRHVDPTSAKPKRIVKNPRVILNPARLTGPRGIQIIPEHFKDFKFKGKGHEKEDLDLVLKKLEHWAYRLYPKFEFKDCLKKMETLGNKRPVMVHLTKIRTDQFISEDTVVQKDSSDDEAPGAPQAPEEDEFDRLLQQQIELARNTPGPGSARKRHPGLATPMADKSQMMPKATSSPSISEEQKQRMLRNRQLAEERRLARLKLSNTGNNSNILEKSTNNEAEQSSVNNNVSTNDTLPVKNKSSTDDIVTNPTEVNTENGTEIIEMEQSITKAKTNRSNVIDSSDSEDDGLVINESVTVDIHNGRNYDDKSNDSDVENPSDNGKEKSANLEEVCDEGISDFDHIKTTESTTAKNLENNVANNQDFKMDQIESNSRESIDSNNSTNIDLRKTVSEQSINDIQDKVNSQTVFIDFKETTVIDKQISETNHDNVPTESSKTDTKELEDEIEMDLDFSDDF